MSCLVYIGFGANLGDRALSFQHAVDALGHIPGTVVTRCSRLHETEPVGLSDSGPTFLNAVVELQTDLAPRALMDAIRNIEVALGKAPDHRSDRSRVADLDLLLYGDERIDADGLIVPHPRMHNRAFVLLPLAELNPDLVVPTVGRTVAELLRDLPDNAFEG
jgi:2-amino-4-hydroxy-6-hydroxymethyldihydropteridine diphosphokinase